MYGDDEHIRQMEQRLAALYQGRRGRMINENQGWCVVCGKNLVNAGAGYDTCDECNP